LCFSEQIFSLWVEDGHRVYELYTSATGFYICLLIARAIAMFAGWLRQVIRAIDTVCRMANSSG
jgi:hypothetical protein